MKKLKEIIQNSNDKEILEYVKSDKFLNVLDDYISQLEKLPEIKDDYVKAIASSNTRQKQLDNIIREYQGFKTRFDVKK